MAHKLDFLDAIGNELIRVQELVPDVESVEVFVNKQPGEPDDCIALFGLLGTFIGEQRDVAELKFPRFQLVTRAVDYNDASDQFEAARTALHGKIGLILPHGVNTATDPYIRIMRMHVESEGGPLGEDDKGRSEFSCNFVVEYHTYDPGE